MKLHLRKYGHTSTSNLSDPASNDNIDAKPTKVRRTPKKPRAKAGQRVVDSATTNNANNSANNNPMEFNAPPIGASPSLANPFNFPLYPGHPLLVHPNNPAPVASAEPEKKKIRLNDDLLKCGMCDFSTANKDHFSQHLMAHAAADQHQRELAYLFGVIPADPSFNSPPNPPQQSQQTPLKGSPSIGANNSTPQARHVNDYLSRMLANPTLLFSTPTTPAIQQQQQQVTEQKKVEASRTPTPDIKTPPPAPPTKPNQTPLDLSRVKDDSVPASGGAKHRRKGQAFKLERSAVPSPPSRPLQRSSPAHSGTPSPPAIRDDDEDDEVVDDDVEDEVDTSLEKPTKKEVNGNRRNGEWGGAYQCSYCDIAFKDVVMYTMHMGYHGFQDPFTCNMCGQSTHDKLAFFLHIARSSHS